MHGEQAWLLRGGLLLIHVVPVVLVVEREDATRRTMRPRAIPHPKLEIHTRIFRLSANLIGRKVAPKPALLSIQLGALDRGVRRCKSCLGTSKRPYHVARDRGHLITG